VEILKKTFKQLLTTGTTNQEGYFIIIPDTRTGVTYSMKILLTADVTDIGFLDPVDTITGDTIYYDVVVNDYKCVKLDIIDTITYGNILFDDYYCSQVEEPVQSTLHIDIKYLCPSGLTSGLAGSYQINFGQYEVLPIYIPHYENSLILDNGVVTFNMYSVEYIVNEVLRPHYQRYRILNTPFLDSTPWIDNTNNPYNLSFNMSGDTWMYFELYVDECIPTTTAYVPTTTAYVPTTEYVPTTTVFGYTTTAYVPTTTAYVPTTTAFGYTTTIYIPTTAYVPTTTVFGYTTTDYVATTTLYVPTTTAYVPTTTEFGFTTTVYVPTTTVYIPTTAYVATTTVYVPTTAYVPTTTVYVPPQYYYYFGARNLCTNCNSSIACCSIIRSTINNLVIGSWYKGIDGYAYYIAGTTTGTYYDWDISVISYVYSNPCDACLGITTTTYVPTTTTYVPTTTVYVPTTTVYDATTTVYVPTTINPVGISYIAYFDNFICNITNQYYNENAIAYLLYVNKYNNGLFVSGYTFDLSISYDNDFVIALNTGELERLDIEVYNNRIDNILIYLFTLPELSGFTINNINNSSSINDPINCPLTIEYLDSFVVEDCTCEIIDTSIYQLHYLNVIGGTGSGYYYEGEEIQINANTPEYGTYFDSWVGADLYINNKYVSNTYIVMQNFDINIIANFSFYTTIYIPTTQYVPTTTVYVPTTTDYVPTTTDYVPTTTADPYVLLLEFNTNSPSTTTFDPSIFGTGTYKWDLGDGTIINSLAVSHTYADSTTKTVRLYGLGTCQISVINLYNDNVVGVVDASNPAFRYTSNIKMSINPLMTGFILPSSIVGTPLTLLEMVSTGIVGHLDFSMFTAYSSSAEIYLDANPTLTGITFAPSVTGTITNLSISSTGIVGALNLSMFTSFGNSTPINLNSNPTMTSVTFAPSISAGTITTLNIGLTGIAGNLDLSMFNSFSNSNINVYSNPSLTGINFASSTTGIIKQLNLQYNNITSNLDLSMFTTFDLTSSNIFVNNNILMTGVNLASSLTGKFANLYFNTTGIVGNLNLSSITSFTTSATLYFYANPTLTGVTFASSVTGSISSYNSSDVGYSGVLDLSMFTSFTAEAAIYLHNCTSLTNILFAPTISGTLRRFYIYNCTSLGYFNMSGFISGTSYNTSTILISSNNWTVAVANHMISDINNISVGGYTGRQISIGGTNAALDSSSGGYDGIAAKTSLQSKGFTVN